MSDNDEERMQFMALTGASSDDVATTVSSFRSFLYAELSKPAPETSITLRCFSTHLNGPPPLSLTPLSLSYH
jgi:hypothetical protein